MKNINELILESILDDGLDDELNDKAQFGVEVIAPLEKINNSRWKRGCDYFGNKIEDKDILVCIRSFESFAHRKDLDGEWTDINVGAAYAVRKGELKDEWILIGHGRRSGEHKFIINTGDLGKFLRIPRDCIAKVFK